MGWLHLATGAIMLLAPFFAFQVAGGVAGAGLLLPLGAVVLTAGVGLLRRAAWAWALPLMIAGSGAVVTAACLWFGGPWAGLGPVLITNLMTLTVLWMARTIYAERGGAGRRRAVEEAR